MPPAAVVELPMQVVVPPAAAVHTGLTICYQHSTREFGRDMAIPRSASEWPASPGLRPSMEALALSDCREQLGRDQHHCVQLPCGVKILVRAFEYQHAMRLIQGWHDRINC